MIFDYTMNYSTKKQTNAKQKYTKTTKKESFMKKSKFFTCLCVVVVIISSTFVGSSSIKPNELENAEIIAQKLFTCSDVSFSKYLSAQYLKGLDEQNDYILVEAENGGYAIFEEENMELIEYSSTDFSPYIGVQSNNCYYAGPSNYFTKNKTFQHICTSKTITDDEATTIANELKKHINLRQTKRAEEFATYKERIKNKSGITKKDSINTTSAGPTGSALISADSYTFTSRNYISDYQFFINNNDHGINIGKDAAANNENATTNTCTAVSTQLLLAYNHWSKDGRLIPYQPDSTTQFLLINPTPAEKEHVNNNLLKGTTSTINATRTSFFEYLLKKIPAGSPLSVSKIGIESYLSEYTQEIVSSLVDVDVYYVPLTSSKEINSILKQEIDSNRPAIAAINMFPIGSSLHSVVVYGYQRIIYNNEIIDGFIAHFGWSSSSKTNVWFNDDWVYSCLTFQTSHTHNDIVYTYEGQPTVDNHLVICTECNRTAHNDDHVYIIHEQSDNTYLNKEYHEAQCHCGYKTLLHHGFEYKQGNATHHGKICYECKYIESEEHFYKNPYTCFYCKQPAFAD